MLTVCLFLIGSLYRKKWRKIEIGLNRGLFGRINRRHLLAARRPPCRRTWNRRHRSSWIITRKRKRAPPNGTGAQVVSLKKPVFLFFSWVSFASWALDSVLVACGRNGQPPCAIFRRRTEGAHFLIFYCLLLEKCLCAFFWYLLFTGLIDRKEADHSPSSGWVLFCKDGWMGWRAERSATTIVRGSKWIARRWIGKVVRKEGESFSWVWRFRGYYTFVMHVNCSVTHSVFLFWFFLSWRCGRIERGVNR